MEVKNDSRISTVVQPGQVWRDPSNAYGEVQYVVVGVRNKFADLECVAGGARIRIATARLRRRTGGWEMIKNAR